MPFPRALVCLAAAALVMYASVSPGLVAHAAFPTARYGRHVQAHVQVYGMRKFPYPYDAMLAISSDADHETLRKFNLIHAFINSTAMTPMGRGLGLDFADSFFMYNGSNLPGAIDYRHVPLKDELTWFRGVSGKRYEAAALNKYIHAGWIDTLHSFGDFSLTNQHETKFNRMLAYRALQALRAHGDFLTVWTDHGNASNVDDFGSYNGGRFYDYQQGANPWSRYYFANRLIAYGVHFVWADLPSDQFGHYSIIYPKRLPDGRKVWAFWRYTNSSFTESGSPDWVWTSDDLTRQLTIQNLLTLEDLRQYAIVAQHLEANNEKWPLSKSTIQALQLLARQYHEGKILVARTSRLLNYNVTQKYLRYLVTYAGGRATVHLTAIDDPVFGAHRPTLTEVRGVTFYTSDPRRTLIEIGNWPVPARLLQYNPGDGRHPSVSVRWFRPDTTDYVTAPYRFPAASRQAGPKKPPGFFQWLMHDIVSWIGHLF